MIRFNKKDFDYVKSMNLDNYYIFFKRGNDKFFLAHEECYGYRWLKIKGFKIDHRLVDSIEHAITMLYDDIDIYMTPNYSEILTFMEEN